MKLGSVYVETYIGLIISSSQLSHKIWIYSTAVYVMFLGKVDTHEQNMT